MKYIEKLSNYLSDVEVKRRNTNDIKIQRIYVELKYKIKRERSRLINDEATRTN